MNRRAFLTGLAATTSSLAIARAVPAAALIPNIAVQILPADPLGGFEVPEEFTRNLMRMLDRGWMAATETRVKVAVKVVEHRLLEHCRS